MARILGIVSCKGGVGKTTAAINLGLVLNNYGRRVVVVDGDFLKPNVGVALGVALDELKESTIHHAARRGRQLDDIVYVHSSGLKFIPGDITATTKPKLAKALLESMKSSELIILDTPPGYDASTKQAIKLCDSVLIIVTPDTSAVQEGLRSMRFCSRLGVPILGIVVNRFKGAGSELTPEDVQKVCGKPILAVIPEDEAMETAEKLKHPITYVSPDSKASVGYKQLAARLLGQRYVAIADKREEESLFKRMMRKLGF